MTGIFHTKERYTGKIHHNHNYTQENLTLTSKDHVLKICELIFNITDFDIGLFDSTLNSICYFTHRNYPDSILRFFSCFETNLRTHLKEHSDTSCFWQAVPELELICLCIRIRISENEYYYTIIGPTLTISYSDTLVKNILKNCKLPPSQKEDFFSLYKSIPLFQTKEKNLFLTAYHLLTTATAKELPPFFENSNPEPAAIRPSTIPSHSAYIKEDLRWNCEKERFWRKAVSCGDIKNATKTLFEMTNIDYMYCTPNDSLQTRRYILFSINTLCRTAALDGGADAVDVHETHNAFFMLIQNLANSVKIEQLVHRMLTSYCNLVLEAQTEHFSPIVKKAIFYIRRYYDQPITLHQVAESIPCGESHLSRCFHKETGTTFKSYLNEFRIKQGISLLETGFYRITDIALLVGFSSYSKFSTAFKKVTGMCASEYLAKH